MFRTTSPASRKHGVARLSAVLGEVDWPKPRYECQRHLPKASGRPSPLREGVPTIRKSAGIGCGFSRCRPKGCVTASGGSP